MSSGPLTPDRDMAKVAPRFRAAVEATLAACKAMTIWVDPAETKRQWQANAIPAAGTAWRWTAFGDATVVRISLEARVWEALRGPELQALYYARGTSKAKSPLYSWHGYGLAVDAISTSNYWFARNDARTTFDETAVGPAWFTAVAHLAKQHGLDWGGDWKMRDTPHLQWGRLRASPSDRARELMAAGGVASVWREVAA